jgi:hypothetical protein
MNEYTTLISLLLVVVVLVILIASRYDGIVGPERGSAGVTTT